VTKRERIQAVIRREPTDRPPYALWRHFPAVDRSPAGLAQSTLRFHERYGSDLLKITPSVGGGLDEWGAVEGDPPGPDGSRPIAGAAIRSADDWKRIRPVELGSSGWGAQLETVIRVVIDRRTDGPVIPTVWSSLSLAHRLAGERLGGDVRGHPQAVADALEAITEMNLRLAEACFAEGAEGLFYCIDAPAGDFAGDDYLRLGAPHDRLVLEAARRRGAIAVLHVRGDCAPLAPLADLRADLWSWEGSAAPSIVEALAMVPAAVIGGLDREGALRHGSADQVTDEAQRAISQAGGLGLVLGTSGGLLMDTPDANLVALARALGGQVKLGLIRPER
jgi:uroporphyrinogen decarboxylase